MGIDLLSLTGHKYLRAEGCGALFVRRRSRGSRWRCQIDGGGHENGLRSGTLNVPGIVGLGRAAEICRPEMADGGGAARRRCAIGCSTGLRAGLDGVRVNGSLERRLPHNLHVSFDGVEGEALLMALGDLAVSTGSACSSGSQAPSHVLEAIGARRRARRRLDPLRPRPHDDRRRYRLRDRPRLDRRPSLRRAMAVS